MLEEKDSTSSSLKVDPFPRSSDDSRNLQVWDEKGRTKLAQMFISYNQNYINSLAFQYIEDGKFISSPIFGSPSLNGPNFVAVMFADAAHNMEYITGVSGSHGKIDYLIGTGVTSLTIETNVATYGPFGRPELKYPPSIETKFDFRFGPEDQFGGFHGTSSTDIITSIGVYVKPIQDLASLSKKTELLVE